MAMPTMTSAGPRIVVGPAQVEELNRYPDTILDNRSVLKEIMSVQFTKMQTSDALTRHSIKADLSTKLGSQIHINLCFLDLTYYRRAQ